MARRTANFQMEPTHDECAVIVRERGLAVAVLQSIILDLQPFATLAAEELDAMEQKARAKLLRLVEKERAFNLDVARVKAIRLKMSELIQAGAVETTEGRDRLRDLRRELEQRLATPAPEFTAADRRERYRISSDLEDFGNLYFACWSALSDCPDNEKLLRHWLEIAELSFTPFRQGIRRNFPEVIKHWEAAGRPVGRRFVYGSEV